jgi:hypothetical protein
MSYGSKEWGPWVLEEEEAIRHIKFAYVAETLSRAQNLLDTAPKVTTQESRHSIPPMLIYIPSGTVFIDPVPDLLERHE